MFASDRCAPRVRLSEDVKEDLMLDRLLEGDKQLCLLRSDGRFSVVTAQPPCDLFKNTWSLCW